jgi:hypothetical protein
MRVELRLLAMTACAIAPALLATSAPVGAADEAFTATKAISAPSGTINSFDISFVDPVLGLYLLGDRTQNAVDVVDTDRNTFVKQLGKGVFTGPGACPPIKQPAGANDCAGPDGVLAVGHREVWAGDGDSTVKVFDLEGAGTTPTYTISTGGLHRADELCVDPKHDVVLVANNAEAPPIPSSATGGLCTAAGGNSANGCIAVFTTPNDDHGCEGERSPLTLVSEEGDGEFHRRRCD